jgi:hypothetical protein
MTIKKVIVIGLIVLMLESISGYVYLTYREKLPPQMPSVAETLLSSSQSQEVAKPLLAVRTPQVLLKKNQTIPIEAVIEGKGVKASAVDLTIKYDPKKLALVASGSAKPFAASPLFQKTVYNAFDAKTGLATMSAVSETEISLPDLATLTTMVFRILQTGPTEITIVFTPGETRDTNIVSESKDILGSVENLPLNIQP